MSKKVFKSFEELGNYLTNYINEGIEKANKDIAKKTKPKEDKIRAYRKEASRLASMGNKRIKRLEEKGLTDSPAYKKWLEDGGEYFGIRGKTYNEVQQEVARMKNFVNSQTSTITGVNKVLKEMAENTGIQYSNMLDLQAKSKQFFELASKVEQYLRTVDDIASAIGYQKIWEAINQQVEKDKIELNASEVDINKLVSVVGNAVKEFDKPFQARVFKKDIWFKLPKR